MSCQVQGTLHGVRVEFYRTTAVQMRNANELYLFVLALGIITLFPMYCTIS